MKLNRRDSLLALGTAATSLATSSTQAHGSGISSHPAGSEQKFRFCLNTSTIRGQKSGIVREVEIAAAAGYDGIEPWIPNLREFRDQGGSIADLGKRIADAGLSTALSASLSGFTMTTPHASRHSKKHAGIWRC